MKIILRFFLKLQRTIKFYQYQSKLFLHFLEAAEGSYEEDQGHIERFFDVADSWSRAVGMNECGQAAICEAHANNRDYGLLALPILFFFPGYVHTHSYTYIYLYVHDMLLRMHV